MVLPPGFSFDPFPTVGLIDTLAVVTGDSASYDGLHRLDGLSGAAEHFRDDHQCGLDENSNQASAIVVPSVQTPIGIVSQAALVLHDDERDRRWLPRDSRSPSNATLQNVGVAGIEPGDSVWVRLDTTGTGFTFRSGDTDLKRVRLVGGAAAVSWKCLPQFSREL